MTDHKTQTRGICQCCGREQAVLSSGVMSKHGYKVSEHGWFVGVCSGRIHKPMQIDRTHADMTVKMVRAEVVTLRANAAKMTAHEINPASCKTNDYDSVAREYRTIPFADGNQWQQRDARKHAVWQFTRRAEMGESFANSLEALADKYHGQALRVVPVDAGPAPVRSGDQRTGGNGRVLTAYRIDGARVYWKDAKGYKGWTGTQAWRRMEAAEAAAA